MLIELDWIVEAQESGIKLLSFLSVRLKGKYSARFLKHLIERNACQINGRMQRFASTILGQGDCVRLYLDQKSFRSQNVIDNSRILFEDEALLVYDKPSAFACDNQGILSLWENKETPVQLVHRLDKDTTGALILAKQPEIYEALVKQFKDFQVEKRYLTIVDGHLSDKSGVIENFLGKKHAFSGQTIWGSVPSSIGLFAKTRWEVLKKGLNATFLACYPKTGRTHQIRVHLAQIGHPILGDFQYGKGIFKCSYHPPRMLLHAESIDFYHPLTHKKMKIAAPLPEDFKVAQEKLFTNKKNKGEAQ